VSRGAMWSAGVMGAAGLILGAATPGPGQPEVVPEIVATGVPRPLQLAIDDGTLVVLSPGWRGDSAGEIFRVDLEAPLPRDLGRQPRTRVPFPDTRTSTFGSLAIHPSSRDVFLGEENGTRLYRLSGSELLTLYASGLRRLPGGSAVAFDRLGRLLVVDYVDQTLSPGEERAPPGLEALREEDYRGPLVFRLVLDPDIPLPRRLDRVAPLFPRAWGGAKGGAMLPRLISVAATTEGDVALLSSSGQVFRLSSDGALRSVARLPLGFGQYNRTNMVGAPDGGVFVSGGFHIGRIFYVSPEGVVTTVASGLADPEGIALDRTGQLYVAESSFHRVVRFRPSLP
jgi:NHL repeat